jgi:hypothetical protein
MTRIIVRAVRDRIGYIEYLQEKLPEAEWCFDTQRNAMHTFLMALRMAGDDPVIHMEEDVLLVPNFKRRIEAEIAKQPDKVIQFFSMRKKDIEVGSRWDNDFLMGQCFYLPAGYSKKILEFHDVWEDLPLHPNGLDTMVCAYLKKKRENYWIVVPNLVDHRIGKSAIDPRRSSKRISKTFKAE